MKARNVSTVSIYRPGITGELGKTMKRYKRYTQWFVYIIKERV